jgi:hypothetical protein
MKDCHAARCKIIEEVAQGIGTAVELKLVYKYFLYLKFAV